MIFHQELNPHLSVLQYYLLDLMLLRFSQSFDIALNMAFSCHLLIEETRMTSADRLALLLFGSIFGQEISISQSFDIAINIAPLCHFALFVK